MEELSYICIKSVFSITYKCKIMKMKRLYALMLSLLLCISAFADESRFEIRIVVNGILQTGDVRIKDKDHCVMYLYDKLNDAEVDKISGWSILYSEVNAGVQIEKPYRDYAVGRRLQFCLQPSFTGKVFCVSGLSKYKGIAGGWGCGYMQNATVKCEFQSDGDYRYATKGFSFDVMPELPNARIMNVGCSGDIDGEKNYDVEMELCDGAVNTAGFIIIYEEDEHDGNPVYLYDYLDEGISLPYIKTLNSICEHSIWCLFNENDYGVRISDWMSLKETDGMDVIQDESGCSIRIEGNSIFVSSCMKMRELKLFNGSGTLVTCKRDFHEFEMQLGKDVYILKLTDCSSKITTKKIIL